MFYRKCRNHCLNNTTKLFAELSTIFLSLLLQRGDILLALNEVSLVGKTHSEAVQIIKSMPAAGTIHFHLIQGDAVEGCPNCLSPDWPAWMEKFVAKRSELIISAF